MNLPVNLPVNQFAPQERRAVARKPLRRPITLTLDNGTTLPGQTIDLSPGGLRMSVDRSITAPQDCTFELTIMLEGKPSALSGPGRILSCVCTGMTGFSLGIQFLKLDEAGKALVARVINGTLQARLPDY